jgi:hypothetical protein
VTHARTRTEADVTTEASSAQEKDWGIVQPPPCPGVEQTHALRDAPALRWPTVKGCIYGTRQARGVARLYFGYLALTGTVLYPVVILPVLALHVTSRRNTVYILRDPHGRITTSLSITAASRRRWIVQGHLSRRPGTEQGRELRNLQTCCAIVPPGSLSASSCETNRPVPASLYMGRLLLVPRPTGAATRRTLLCVGSRGLATRYNNLAHSYRGSAVRAANIAWLCTP